MDSTPAGDGFGRKLREFREAAGKSLKEMARAAKYDAGYLSKVERDIEPVTPMVVQRYDHALELDRELIWLHHLWEHPVATLPVVPDLVGQDQHLAEIHTFLTCEPEPPRAQGRQTTRVLLICGLALGASALAVVAAHTARAHFDGVHYVDLAGFGPPPHTARTPAEALGELLAAMQITPIGTSLAERRLQYRTALASRPGRRRRILIVLDNAHSAQQIQDLLPGADAVDTTILITSCKWMTDLTNVQKHRITLAPLSHDQCATLLADKLAEHGSAAAAGNRLAALTGGVPVLVRMLAEWIATTQPEMAESDLLGDARDYVATLTEPPSPVVAKVEWVLDSLSDEAGQLVRALGVWRADEVPLTVEAMAALAGLTTSRTRQLVTELEWTGVLLEHDPTHNPHSTKHNSTIHNRHTPHPTRRYRMTLLGARYAAHHAPAQDPDVRRAAHRLASWYLHTVQGASNAIAPWRAPLVTPVADGVHPRNHRTAADAVDWLDREHDALFEVSRMAMRYGARVECWQLAVALRGWLEINADLELWIDTHERALAAALMLRDRIAVATVQTQLALGLHLASRPDEYDDQPCPAPGMSGDSSHDVQYDRAVKVCDLAITQWQHIARDLPGSVLPHYITAYGGDDSAVAAVAGVARRGEAWAHRTMAMIRGGRTFVADGRESAAASLALLHRTDHEENAESQIVYADLLRRTPGARDLLTQAEMRVQAAIDHHLWHLGEPHRLLSRAHTVHAAVFLIRACRHGDVEHHAKAEEAMRLAVEAIRRTGDRDAHIRLLIGLAQICLDVHDHDRAGRLLDDTEALAADLDADRASRVTARIQAMRAEAASRPAAAADVVHGLAGHQVSGADDKVHAAGM